LANEAGQIFIDSSIRRLQQMCSHVGKCMSLLDDDQLWSRHGAHENAIGNLILHVCGNARQWIVSGVGGAKDVRDRDSEFAAQGDWTREQLNAHLQKTMTDAIAVLASLDLARLTEIISPQNHTVPVLEAIYQVVAHFQQHAGQIIFATKLMSGDDLGLVMPRKTASA
jgi:uncharacterized damage-inducible protein DinB